MFAIFKWPVNYFNCKQTFQYIFYVVIEWNAQIKLDTVKYSSPHFGCFRYI